MGFKVDNRLRDAVGQAVIRFKQTGIAKVTGEGCEVFLMDRMGVEDEPGLMVFVSPRGGVTRFDGLEQVNYFKLISSGAGVLQAQFAEAVIKEFASDITANKGADTVPQIEGPKARTVT